MSIYQVPEVFDSLKTFVMTEDDYSRHEVVPLPNFSHKGSKLTDDHKRAISQGMIGNKHLLGKKFSNKTKKKMSKSHKGKKHSIETKAKQSATHKKIPKIMVSRIKDRKVMDVGNFFRHLN